MKRNIYLILVSSGLIFFFIFFYLYTNKNKSQVNINTANKNISQKDREVEKKTPTATINDKVFKLDVAKTPEELAKGLSGREILDQDQGMLFVFEEPSIRTFWMKDMNFALDMIWVNDGKIIYISKNVQPPEEGTPDYKLSRYSSKKEVDYVLEINAGLSDALGFEVGDEISFDL